MSSRRSTLRAVLPLRDNAPTRRFPVVTVGLIAANALVWLWELGGRGLAATAAQTGATLFAGTANDASIPNVGASDAIAGVLGAYFLLLPRARVLTLIFFGIVFFREIPAVWFLGIWIALQLWTGGLSLLRPGSGGGVAFFAHIGGFAFGLLTVLFVARHRPRPPGERWPVW